MATELNFDATQVEPNRGSDPLPAGWHRAHIVDSEMKPTKDGKGKYLQLEFECLDEPLKNRKFWDRLNLVNPSTEAVRIAQSQLSALCHAAGVLRINHSSQLHHIPVLVKLTIKQDEGFEPRNEIRGYKTTSAAAVAAQPTSAPAGARPAAPPWAQGGKAS